MTSVTTKGTTMSSPSIRTTASSTASAPTVDRMIPLEGSGRLKIIGSLGADITQSDTDIPQQGHHHNATPTHFSGRRRRSTKDSASRPFRTVDDFHNFELRPGWRPGSEPGLDPYKPHGGRASTPSLSAACEITIVDFCQESIETHRLNNDNLVEFLEKPQPKWATCRWVNVNGLSWDVIQALGQYKGFHQLAVEDIMNTRNRTKAEMFTSHAFIVLTLQKLVHFCDPGSEEDIETDDEDDDYPDARRIRRWSLPRWLRRLSRSMTSNNETLPDPELGRKPGDVMRRDKSCSRPPSQVGIAASSSTCHHGMVRTLQKHHSHHWQPNDARTEYMEKNSALASKDLVVAAEQVSMFLMNDNCLISFFEMSAQDIEIPIVRRLETPDTLLRQCCDASMVAQAVIDAIIDLAIPISSSYQEVIADLELDVVTDPNIDHTKKLYIMVTEIQKMLSFINPITTLINSLRDHTKTDFIQEEAAKQLQDKHTGVIITPITHTYLGDVLDHTMLISEELNQVRGQADGMINLIFNTISARQNESMKQLTFVTIVFLPLTFLTGYFGMNFVPFAALESGIGLFWKIGIPVLVATIVILMRGMIWRAFATGIQRYHIGKLRTATRRRTRRKDRKNDDKHAKLH